MEIQYAESYVQTSIKVSMLNFKKYYYYKKKI